MSASTALLIVGLLGSACNTCAGDDHNDTIQVEGFSESDTDKWTLKQQIVIGIAAFFIYDSFALHVVDGKNQWSFTPEYTVIRWSAKTMQLISTVLNTVTQKLLSS